MRLVSNRIKRMVYVSILAIIFLLCLTGCTNNQEKDTKVVLTTGFAKDEVFKIESISCTLPEIMVYLTTTQNQYESVYGTQIWDTNLDGVTLEENVKDTVLAKIAQIKTMTLLAKRHELTLSDEDMEKVKAAAHTYYTSLNDDEISAMGVTEDTIVGLYSEYALADQVYQYIIKDINPEISDDEARTITVQQILIKTSLVDGKGNRQEYTAATKEKVYQKAQEALSKAQAGEDFEELISQYSEDETGTYSFGKGEMEQNFEDAAFNLGTDEISGLIETQYGYHIIKCISTFNKEETDANKVKIVEQRKEEVFGQEYDAFVTTLARDLNDELWDSITFIHNDKVKTSNFFDVFDETFNK